MRYAGIIKNDFAAAPGVCLTFFVQGCPIKCKGCHNLESWDFCGGKEFTLDVINEIEQGLTTNGIERTLCIMGGEPLCIDNLPLTTLVVKEIKNRCPWVKIWIWTGYEMKVVNESNEEDIIYLLNTIDGLVTGPYIEEQRDISLFMRGSSNQEIIDLNKRRQENNE